MKIDCKDKWTQQDRWLRECDCEFLSVCCGAPLDEDLPVCSKCHKPFDVAACECEKIIELYVKQKKEIFELINQLKEQEQRKGKGLHKVVYNKVMYRVMRKAIIFLRKLKEKGVV